MTSSLHGQRLNRGNDDEGEYGEEFMRNLRMQVIINGGIPDERVLQGAFNINDNDLTGRFDEYRGLTTRDQRITFYNEMVRRYGIRVDDPHNNARGIIRHKRKSSKRKSSKRRSSKRKSSKRRSSKRKSYRHF